MKKRNQIENKYKWDLNHIYSNEKDLYNDIEKLKKYPEILSSYKGKLKKPNMCLEFFKLSTEVSKIIEKVEIYIGLKLAENLEDAKYLELNSVVSYIAKNLSVATSFEESELLSYGEKYINKLLKDERFAVYSMSLKNFLRNKDHILNEEQEIMLSKAMKSLGGFSDVYDNIDTLDLKFGEALDSKGKKHEVTQQNYHELMENKDRVLRKNASLSMLKGYHSLCNTISANYIGSLEGDWFVADTYRFFSTLEMSLFGDNINEKIYHILLKNIGNNLHYMHRFYKLKQKALGQKDFYFYDRSVPITNVKNKMTFEDSFKIVIDAMSVLGEEYIEGLLTAKDNNWIDVYPCEKKETGGFCCGMFEPHPYILLNTIDDSTSIYTLAHELGHAMHGYLSAKNLPYELYDHTIFLAEIASTTNEVLLFKYLYNISITKKDKLSHLEKYASNIIATIYVQTMYSEFEYFAHDLVEKGLPISKEILNNKWKELTLKYYGKNVKLLKDDIGETWMRIPHFYRAYYVYKYATGMTSAINFANKIFSGDNEAKDKYLEFLKSGSTDYSINLLTKAGVDLESDEPYNIVFKELEWVLDEMEKLI